MYKPILDKSILDSLHSDYAEVSKANRKRINNLNRQRSKNQERAVTKFLGGNRVPMSGGGAIKGDGLWNSPIGLVVMECKYSSVDRHGNPCVRIPFQWIPKMLSDARAMKAKFGMFVFHFHMQKGGYPNDLCLIPEESARLFLDPAWIDASPTIDGSVERSGHLLIRKKVDACIAENPLFPCMKLLTIPQMFVILELHTLKDLFNTYE